MTPKILQSLISINRNSIREYECSVELYKDIRDNDQSIGYYEAAAKCNKLMQAKKKHLALLVRNQVALKKALREAYADKHYWKTVGVLVHDGKYGEIDCA